MGLSTHVLDTMHGTPAAHMAASLWRTSPDDEGAASVLLQRFVLNADGRNPEGPLIATADLQTGCYRLVFDVAGYFAQRGVQLAEPPFLGLVRIDFGIGELTRHYHVPLLVSPWSYSTYRGS